MPYIDELHRGFVARGNIRTVGDLTYVLQQVVSDYLTTKGLSYQSLAEVLGALEGLKFDVYRRLLAPYEQVKQEQNGEVWPLALRAKANGTV